MNNLKSTNNFDKSPILFSLIKRYLNYFEEKEKINNLIEHFDIKNNVLQINKNLLEKMNKKQNEYLDYNELYDFCVFDPNIYSCDQLELNENNFSSQHQENIYKTYVQLNEYSPQYYNFERICEKFKENLKKKMKIFINFLANRFKNLIENNRDNNVKLTKGDMYSLLLNIVLEKKANFLQYSLINELKSK